jgi:hypothetical protein
VGLGGGPTRCRTPASFRWSAADSSTSIYPPAVILRRNDGDLGDHGRGDHEHHGSGYYHCDDSGCYHYDDSGREHRGDDLNGEHRGDDPDREHHGGDGDDSGNAHSRQGTLGIRVRAAMNGASAHPRAADDYPRVTIARRPLWRIRLARGLPRYVLYGLAVAAALASARFALDPPRVALPAALLRRPAGEDLAAEGFATLFARAYLTWEAQHPEARERALAPFVGSGIDADAGLQPPASGEQRVQWTQVVQERQPQPDAHVYTVAAQTDTAGLLYLTVSVLHKLGSPLALAGYPAFVGPPASGPAQADADGRLREVSQPALTTVVERALRNYLAGSPSELAADLASEVHVSSPGIELALQSLQSLQWASGAGAVLALVQAQDQRGASYTLAYELDVLRAQGRWEVSAIQMDPDT